MPFEGAPRGEKAAGQQQESVNEEQRYREVIEGQWGRFKDRFHEDIDAAKSLIQLHSVIGNREFHVESIGGDNIIADKPLGADMQYAPVGDIQKLLNEAYESVYTPEAFDRFMSQNKDKFPGRVGEKMRELLREQAGVKLEERA